MREVKLVYYRYGGKFATEGSYETNKEHLFEIHEEVRGMLEARKLPGLIKGHSLYLVSVEVPDHPHNHPRLVMCEGLRQHLNQIEIEGWEVDSRS